MLSLGVRFESLLVTKHYLGTCSSNTTIELVVEDDLIAMVAVRPTIRTMHGCPIGCLLMVTTNRTATHEISINFERWVIALLVHLIKLSTCLRWSNHISALSIVKWGPRCCGSLKLWILTSVFCWCSFIWRLCVMLNMLSKLDSFLRLLSKMFLMLIFTAIYNRHDILIKLLIFCIDT